MQSQATERSTCSTDVKKEPVKESLTQKVKKGAKKLVIYLLIKPSTWRFIMVKVPEYWEKAEEVIHQAIGWISDFF